MCSRRARSAAVNSPPSRYLGYPTKSCHYSMSSRSVRAPGCPWPLTGARQFVALRSYLSTPAKTGVAMLDALGRLAKGCSWLPSEVLSAIV